MSLDHPKDHSQRVLEKFSEFFPGATSVGSYVQGALLPGAGEEIVLTNPADARPFLRYADAGEAVVAQAVESARQGQKAWWAMPAAQRGRVMQDIARQIRQHHQSLAELEALGAGKPIRDCMGEVAKVAEMFEYYAGWCDKLHGRVIPVPSGHLNYTLHEPYGVVLLITPWNAPVFTCGWNAAPALAAGNAVVLKPSELTPLSSLAVAALASKAGLPDGVFNVLAGFGHTAARAAMAHAGVRKVAFIGSPATGALVAADCAARGISCVLELGGKSANIVFADADLRRACIGAQAAIFSAAGQSCVAGSRLLVQREIYDRFVDMVAAGAARIRVGDPLSGETEVGPIQNEKQYAHVLGMIRAAQAEGAQVVQGCDGQCGQGGQGFFVRPTVIRDVHNGMAIARGEVFGPVVAAIPFDTEEEAIALANDNPFGLAGAVWTGDIGRAHRVAAAVEAGTFWINTYKYIHVSSPFGGYKGSGHGRSSGVEVLHEYTQTKSVWVETSADPVAPFGYAPEQM